MQCPKCGKQISNTATFCGYCGATIAVKKEEFYEAIQEESNKDNKTKSKPDSFITILLCLLIATVLGIVAFLIAKNCINNEPVSINKSSKVKKIEVQDDETKTEVSFIEDAEADDAEKNITENDIVDETQEKETSETPTSNVESNSVSVNPTLQNEHKLDNYVDYLNKSKDELKSRLKSFELYEDKLKPFYMYSGTDEAGNTYMFGFMDGIDKCCVVETGIEKAFPGLTEIYESYERIDKDNIEKYIGTEIKLKVDNLYGYYLEYGYRDCSVRVLCNDDGSTGYIAGLYVTQNEPSFLEWVEKEYPVPSAR